MDGDGRVNMEEVHLLHGVQRDMHHVLRIN